MRPALLLLLLIPAAIAINCSYEYDGLSLEKTCKEGHNYCHVEQLFQINQNGLRELRTSKDCGETHPQCDNEWCSNFASGMQCCCKGENCNRRPVGTCYVNSNRPEYEYLPRQCPGNTENFCYTKATILNGERSVDRRCELNCKREGCTDVPDGVECCCKGDLCNDMPRGKCIVGNHTSYTTADCLIETGLFCQTEEATLEGVRTVRNGCGDTCVKEGCTDIPGGKKCCCKGDMCNDSPKGKCFVGSDASNKTADCSIDTDLFCYREDTTTDGVRTITKSCGAEKCKVDGCTDELGVKKCCCKGELCNYAAQNSLLTAALAAAAAATVWMRN